MFVIIKNFEKKLCMGQNGHFSKKKKNSSLLLLHSIFFPFIKNSYIFIITYSQSLKSTIYYYIVITMVCYKYYFIIAIEIPSN